MASISTPHRWTFVLTDIQGNVIGEITRASSRVVTLPLNRVPTASFQIPVTSQWLPYFMDASWDGMVKCYRDGVLRFCGPIISTAEAFDDVGQQTVAVNAAGALWRLSYRLLGTGPAGWALGNAGTQYDLGYIAQQMLAAGNGVAFTGIIQGTNVNSSNGSAGTYFFKDVLSAIGEMATGANSFDFEAVPVEPQNVSLGIPKIAVFNTTSLIGTVKPNAVFEYGTSKANVQSYGRQIDRSALCNKGYIQQPAAADYSGTLTSSDTASQSARGVYEALIDNGGVEWDILRQKLADENVRIRKQARQVITFTPVTNAVPSPFDDYIVGDQVRTRINVEQRNVMDAMMRVWGITFSIDDEGNEAPTLELVQP